MLPDIVATSFICWLSEISSVKLSNADLISSTAASIPFLISTGFCPAATCFNPSCKIACARQVDVVVPSPTKLPVLIDTCFTACAPIDSTWSSKSPNALATDTPSLVMVNWPWLSLIKTVLPAGPNVDDTLLFSFSTPLNNLLFNSVPNTVSVIINLL